MKKTIISVFVLACSLVSSADVRGVYRLGGERQLVLSADNQALAREGDRNIYYGSWRVERVEGRDRVVMQLRSEVEWQAELPGKVWILDVMPDGKGLRPIGVGRGTLEDAVESMKTHAGDSLHAPVMELVEGVYDVSVAKEVDSAIAKLDAPVQAMKERRRQEESKERMRRDPRLLREVRFKYPDFDPEESVPDADTLHMQYPPEMRIVFDMLLDTGVALDEETLESMLDRVDWQRGEVLAFWGLRREELGADALRKYAPRVLERIGKTDKYLLRMFFENPNLPSDVRENACRMGWSDK